MADKTPYGEVGGKGGTGFEEDTQNFSVCPEGIAEHAFPGHKPGEPLINSKCAIPRKAKYKAA